MRVRNSEPALGGNQQHYRTVYHSTPRLAQYRERKVICMGSFVSKFSYIIYTYYYNFDLCGRIVIICTRVCTELLIVEETLHLSSRYPGDGDQDWRRLQSSKSFGSVLLKSLDKSFRVVATRLQFLSQIGHPAN